MLKGLLFFVLAVNIFPNNAKAEVLVDGQISNIALQVEFGASAGTDWFNISGNYILGAGSNGLSLPQNVVIVNFDGGKFVQALPTNSLVPIAGGYRYSSTNSGIQLLKIMDNGTFTLQVRQVDLTGVDSRSYGGFTITVGDDVFSAVPNSIPVARISGASEVNVGAEFVLSGADSADYNNDSLLYNWSLVSKPEGSLANLTNTNAVSASFVSDKNGWYVFKLIVNDGISDGVPALFTVKATGGSELPPLLPGANNGLIQLSADKPDYFVGEFALLTLSVLVPPGNGTNEYFYRATFNNEPVELVPGLVDTELTYTTVPFTTESVQEFRVALYIQNRVLARQLADTISYYQSAVTKVDAALLHETDPAVIAALLADKEKYLEQMAKAEVEQEKNRTKLSHDAVLSFAVNP